jgi:soluble lytic murein transglycosylase-like protein
VRVTRVADDVADVERRMASLADDRATTSADRASRAFAHDVSGAMRTLVTSAARRADVDPSLALAVAATESHFDPQARSAAGAIGVMQLMPRTAQALGVANPYDPAQNVRGGTLYLRELLDRFGGDVRRAVAAYDAGPHAVIEYAGVPPYPETRRYVERVMAAYRERAR